LKQRCYDTVDYQRGAFVDRKGHSPAMLVAVLHGNKKSPEEKSLGAVTAKLVKIPASAFHSRRIVFLQEYAVKELEKSRPVSRLVAQIVGADCCNRLHKCESVSVGSLSRLIAEFYRNCTNLVTGILVVVI
jgi:hypothetical protein